MSSKKELKLAYGIAVVLLVVGVFCYTGFSDTKASEEPLRVMFKNPAGNVLFGHEEHAADYGFSCYACHHHPEESGEGPVVTTCGACHNLPKDGSLPVACLDCHEEDEVDLVGVPDRTESFHVQCIECHLDNGAGFTECAECHPI